MKYRPEIDGLRAIAVTSVMFYHAGFSWISGGYIGVDVFFVISGFLITSIIISDLEQGRFSILRFYDRRIRRILPALMLVVLVSIGFAWAWMLPDEFTDFMKSVAGLSVFSSNIVFWSEDDYFATASELKPLLHTWSLAVEEQFYLFFPPLLALLWRGRRARVTRVLGLLFIASLIYSEIASWYWPAANFYLPMSRIWELLAGAFLAIYGAPALNRTMGQGFSLLGLVMIVVPFFELDDTSRFPGLLALPPVLGSVLVIAYASPRNLAGRLLATRGFVGIGLISYSAYLWHQPVMAFARMRILPVVSDVQYLGLIGFSFGLAYLSWRFVEGPFRRKGRTSNRVVISIAILASLPLLIVGRVGGWNETLPRVIPPEVLDISELTKRPRIKEGNCFQSLRDGGDTKTCGFNPELGNRVAIWGDSHALAIKAPLANALRAQGEGLIGFVTNACVPVLGVDRNPPGRDCAANNATAYDYLTSSPDVGIVILIARYPLNFSGQRFTNDRGVTEFGKPVVLMSADGTIRPSNPQEQTGLLSQRNTETIAGLTAAGKKVVLIYPVPEMGWNVPDLIMRRIMTGQTGASIGVSHGAVQQRFAVTEAEFAKIDDTPNLLRFRPENLFCNTYVAGECVGEVDGNPIYFDDDHLNRIGAKLLADRLIRDMQDAGWLE